MRCTLFAGPLLLAIAGCAPTVQATYLGPASNPEPRSDTRIEVYSARAPECPFDELGLLRILTSPALGFSESDALTAMKQKARHLGADAIVGLANYSVPTTAGSRSGFRGTAIRFRDEACTQ